MSDDIDNGEPEGQPLGVFLQQHRRGATRDDIEVRIREATLAAMETGKKASVTVKFEFSPGKDGSTVFVTDDVKANIPQPDRGGSIMFPDANGNLHRSDPNQMQFERFHVVETAANEPVVVDADTGEIREIN